MADMLKIFGSTQSKQDRLQKNMVRPGAQLALGTPKILVRKKISFSSKSRLVQVLIGAFHSGVSGQGQGQGCRTAVLSSVVIVLLADTSLSRQGRGPRR